MGIPYELARIPYYGVGIGLRSEIADETMQHKEDIDVLEIITELFFDNHGSGTLLDEFAAQFPIIPHGVKLSIGTALPTEESFLEKVKEVVGAVGAHYYSDHFALTRIGDELDIGHLSPIWFTKESLETVTTKIHAIQNTLGVPLVLENITSPFDIGEADYTEPEFITRICEETGCGLLLDLTNVHINAFNRGTDPYEFLNQLPLEYVVQTHLAGGMVQSGVYLDTHSEEIAGDNEGVWQLLEWTAQRAPIKALIIERDDNFREDFDAMLLRDVRRARGIVEDAQRTMYLTQEKKTATHAG